jgi:hypothetical protein
VNWGVATSGKAAGVVGVDGVVGSPGVDPGLPHGPASASQASTTTPSARLEPIS